MTPEELKREDEFLEAQAKAIREHVKRLKIDGWNKIAWSVKQDPKKYDA